MTVAYHDIKFYIGMYLLLRKEWQGDRTEALQPILMLACKLYINSVSLAVKPITLFSNGLVAMAAANLALKYFDEMYEYLERDEKGDKIMNNMCTYDKLIIGIRCRYHKLISKH